MKATIFALSLFVCVPVLANGPTLVELVQRENVSDALEMVHDRADVNQPSVDGTTALHWASYYGELDLARRLIRAGADVNVQNDYGSSPMGEAAAAGDADMIKLLLDSGADVESSNPDGQTALMAVARTGNIEAAELLIEAGANPNAAENWGGQTALMWAAARHHPQMIRLLSESGANLEQRAIDRNWDRRVTSEPRVKEMHMGGFTALLYAARENCLECVKALVEAGADINKPNPNNISPLNMALENIRFDVAKYLIEQGADVNQWDFWGRAPLYMALDVNISPASFRNDPEPIYESITGIELGRMLLERGANPNMQLKLPPLPRQIYNDRAGDYEGLNTGTTPIQRAAYGGDIEFMALLLEYGAIPTLANINGVSPLSALAGTGGSRNRDKTEAKVIEGFRLLFESGIDINTRGAGGTTTLHTAARQNWLDTVRFLAEHGANMDTKDSGGLTPLDYATGGADSQRFGNFDVVGELPEMAALLRELGATERRPADE